MGQAAQNRARDLMTVIRNQVSAGNLMVLNQGLNVDLARGLVFVHNPKVMGTSLKNLLGLPTDNADHRFPTVMVSKRVWEEATTIVAVRHPIERFVSSFHFHCRSDYDGGYLTRFPDLKEWTMERYFETMTTHCPYVIAPQWKYTFHMDSECPPDFLIRFEDPKPEIQRLRSQLGLPQLLLRMNVRSQPPGPMEDALRERLVRYYRRDFDEFGYTP
ncbi:MAG: sulfotransferase family 2 domain-containing protein [Myxococcota bacterium]|nr:sulfotransferase family 2 domain-containing protein [Myxococcota bacterium]